MEQEKEETLKHLEREHRLNKYAREKVVDRLIASVKAQEVRFQHDWSHAPLGLEDVRDKKDLDEEMGKALNKLRENNIKNRLKFEEKYKNAK